MNKSSNMAHKSNDFEFFKTESDSFQGGKVSAILFDDDPTFGQVMMRYASHMNVILDVSHSISDFTDLISSNIYQVAILDYYLDYYTGMQIASSMGGMPTVLVSRKSQWKKQTYSWPEWVRAFVHKKYGADTILKTAISVAKGLSVPRNT